MTHDIPLFHHTEAALDEQMKQAAIISGLTGNPLAGSPVTMGGNMNLQQRAAALQAAQQMSGCPSPSGLSGSLIHLATQSRQIPVSANGGLGSAGGFLNGTLLAQAQQQAENEAALLQQLAGANPYAYANYAAMGGNILQDVYGTGPGGTGDTGSNQGTYMR